MAAPEPTRTSPSPSSTAQPPSSPAMPETIELHRLLPEIRCMIWERALPDPRVFHVRQTFGSWNGWSADAGSDFHVYHEPPVLLRVCHESRTVAERKGIYLGRRCTSWFNPQIDVLYFDKTSKNLCLPRLTGAPSLIPVRNWDKVRNVGVEWRAFFHKTPRPQSAKDMRAMWRSIIRLLQMYLPGLQLLHYVLPMVRHRGGLTWGREPYGSHDFEAELLELPEPTKIPWGDALILNPPPQVPAGAAAAMAELLDMRKNQLIPWGSVKRDIQAAMDEDDGELTGDECADWMVGVERQDELPMPKIVGRWLVRPDAKYEEDMYRFAT